MKKKPVSGISLVEVMVAIGVLGILVSVAAPSFTDFIKLQRLKSINAQLITDLQLARSEAAARNMKVAVRFGSDTASSCYVLFTYVEPANNNTACSCNSSTTCTGTGNEIRTARVARDSGVQLAVYGATNNVFSYMPATGEVEVVNLDSEGNAVPGLSIAVYLDTQHAMRTVVSMAGRPSACIPSGSAMAGVRC